MAQDVLGRLEGYLVVKVVEIARVRCAVVTVLLIVLLIILLALLRLISTLLMGIAALGRGGAARRFRCRLVTALVLVSLRGAWLRIAALLSALIAVLRHAAALEITAA